MRILYNFASRSRKEKFFNCLDNIISLAKHDDYVILASLDIDDTEMSNKEVQERFKKYGSKVIPLYGFSKNKIDAINRSIYHIEEWDVVLNHSDDFVFTKEGFDLDILEAFNGFSGLVHFPDQMVKERLITYAMMSRDYYELDHNIYDPRFISVYADNWQQLIAQKRGKYKFVNIPILEHHHPIWGYGEPDELLKQTENPINYAKDKQTFEKLQLELNETT